MRKRLQHLCCITIFPVLRTLDPISPTMDSAHMFLALSGVIALHASMDGKSFAIQYVFCEGYAKEVTKRQEEAKGELKKLREETEN